MTLKLSHLARQDLEDIRTFTVERWGRAQWLDYYRGLVDTFEMIKAHPMSGRRRDLFRKGIRSVKYGRHVVFFSPVEAALRPDPHTFERSSDRRATWNKNHLISWCNQAPCNQTAGHSGMSECMSKKRVKQGSVNWRAYRLGLVAR
ncbi:type II toxin-antitoxin system RelE/ParE family toxin [Roseovarius tibetensis]|uniref:type II toxin-antitoxin system RelE/ParE family toxin n=1 Tax=Roseovarius tibetensis TaxID=2685897 RepID=UPI003D7FD251